MTATHATVPGLTRSRSVRVGGWSGAVSQRSVVVGGVLLLLLLGAALASLLFGEIQMGLPRLWIALRGDGTSFEDYLVWDSRLPRVAAAVVVGAALGCSGAIFQTVSRNPLGSPDIIGFEGGAASGGLMALLLFGTGFTGASIGAVLGGLTTALIVYALALSNGLDGLRLVLIGVGMGAMLLSFNSMLIVEADIHDAQEAANWLVGSLAGASADDLAVQTVIVATLLALALCLSPALTLAELSDDAAAGLGQRTSLVRLGSVVVGVLLCSVAVAAAGPIAFIALTAPQIARRLTRSGGPNLAASAITGALLLVLADHAARELLQPRQVPVGVVTGLFGGAFLAWLLTREWRKGRA